MKDYSNYSNYDPLERRLRNGKKIFDVSKRGINSYKSIIDKTIEADILIELAYNPYSEKKEERIFKCDLDIDIGLGSTIYIEETEQTFITVTDINQNRIFQFFKGIELNYTLNWVDSKGDLHSVLTYMYDKDVYSVGVKEIKFIPTLHEQLFMTLQQDEDTDTIVRGTRFIIDGYAWEVTNINRALGKIMKLSVKEVTTNMDDNVEDEVADEDSIKKISIRVLNGNDISLAETQSFKLTTEVKKGETILGDAIIVYSSHNPLIASVDKFGVVKGVSEGATKIDLSYNDIKTSVDVNITALETITYKAIIEGQSSIRNGKQSEYINTPTANGEYVDLISEWYITDENDEYTDLATIEVDDLDSQKCVVSATRSKKTGIIRLHVKNIIETFDEIDGSAFNEIVRDYIEIEIKSIFAP